MSLGQIIWLHLKVLWNWCVPILIFCDGHMKNQGTMGLKKVLGMAQLISISKLLGIFSKISMNFTSLCWTWFCNFHSYCPNLCLINVHRSSYKGYDRNRIIRPETGTEPEWLFKIPVPVQKNRIWYVIFRYIPES